MGQKDYKNLSARLKALEDKLRARYVKESREWSKINREMQERFASLTDVTDKVTEISDTKNPVIIAATELFVERAQQKLTRRAFVYFIVGLVCAVLAMGILAYAAYHLANSPLPEGLSGNSTVDLKVAILILAKSSTVAAFIVGIAVFLSGLAKSFFHEATVLYNRRHALRFGRLYAYVSDGKMSLGELQKAFQWNDEFPTAFRSVATEIKTPMSKIIDGPADMLRAIRGKSDGETVDAVNKEKNVDGRQN